jgi:predicted Zn finger-like uncharacterized protein
MNVTCPNCATTYRVDPNKVPEAGVRARCAVCSAVFAVRRDGAETPAPVPAMAAAAPPGPVPATPAPAVEAAPVVQPAVAAAPEPAAAPSVAAPPAAPADVVEPPRPPVPPAFPAAPAAAAPASMPAPATPTAASRAPVAPPAVPGMRPAMPAAPRAPAPPAAPAGAVGGTRPVNPFLSKDPSAKARRLARALISDMVVYHPAKRKEGLRDGNLKALFEEEIKKSWEEYTDQVGREIAESTPYFREALNEILADGRQLF